MISRNLRHLRVFLEVVDTGSVTHSANRCNVSQPAVTQSIGKLERDARGALFDRTRQGFFATERGKVLAGRLQRAFAHLDPAMEEISPRLRLTATTAQLNALIAVCEAENFTLAARRLGIAQPTVHRAITRIEQEAARALFERTSFGLLATRPCRALAQAAQLAFTELDQADAELAELDGAESGRIVVGALPLSRSVILPRALVEFRRHRPTLPLKVIDGRYGELLTGLRRGDIDLLVGALRDPAPIGDIVQEPLFDDYMTVVAGRNHPLAERETVTIDDLKGASWVVPRAGTPARGQFDAVLGSAGAVESVIEAGSILLMREILDHSDHLGCISSAQAEAEVEKGLLVRLPVRADWPGRPIGLTYRKSWVPTRSQELLLKSIHTVARDRVPRLPMISDPDVAPGPDGDRAG